METKDEEICLSVLMLESPLLMDLKYEIINIFKTLVLYFFLLFSASNPKINLVLIACTNVELDYGKDN